MSICNNSIIFIAIENYSLKTQEHFSKNVTVALNNTAGKESMYVRNNEYFLLLKILKDCVSLYIYIYTIKYIVFCEIGENYINVFLTNNFNYRHIFVNLIILMIF